MFTFRELCDILEVLKQIKKILEEYMKKIKQSIEQHLAAVAAENRKREDALTDTVRLTAYSPKDGVWTDALQRALNEHSVIVIPASDKPYRLDGTVTVPSDRKIVAEDGAVIRLGEGTRVLMLRNTTTADGTLAPIHDVPRNENITIEGGIWEESCLHRKGYGESGMYDAERSFFGVSTCMLLENIDHLTLRNMTFRHCGGFAVQIGEARGIIIENITFEECYADGIHVNGNVEDIHIRNVQGQVGDDLVAFNMFDWQNSSINFGPCRNVICEDLTLSEDSHYKALRIEPGIYTFRDGSQVDCSLENAVFRRIRNIKTFKLYCQTPVYGPNRPPEPAGVGSGNNVIFEDIRVDLDGPIDCFDEYLNGDPTVGSFAAFELGLNVKNLFFHKIDLVLHRERFPYSYLLCIGPKSIRLPNGDEVFDPYFSSTAENVYFSDITVNGLCRTELSPYLREIVFDGLYGDMPSTARGRLLRVITERK